MKRIRAADAPTSLRPASGTPRIRISAEAPRASTGISLIDAMDDDRLFAPWFRRRRESWSAWRVFIKAMFGLEMDAEDLALYRQCTGRADPPNAAFAVAYLICGRRAGKTFCLALICVFIACFRNFEEFLAPGERGTIMLIASDRRQARSCLRYMAALLKEVPLLAKRIEREVADGFDLQGRISIEVTTASMKSVRGYTVVAAVLDEAAFFSTEDGSASPDAEIVAAIRPAMVTIPGALLLVASSPYAKRGILWDAFKNHFGKDADPTLVWQAASKLMNSTIPQEFLDAEYEKDPISAASEYGAQFRSDLEEFVSIDTIMQCVSDGIYERPRERGIKYQAFLDPAGGSGKDSFTMAIGHRDKATGISVLDVIREMKPPFSPEAVVADYANVLKSFAISKVIGDRFAGMWCVELFRKHGITYDPSAKPKSDLYRDALPLLNSRKADLLDHKRLVQQFVGLERRVARSGKDSIDHAPNGHDDLCNVVAGLLCNLGTRPYRYDSSLSWVGEATEDSNKQWRHSQLVGHMLGGRRLF